MKKILDYLSIARFSFINLWMLLFIIQATNSKYWYWYLLGALILYIGNWRYKYRMYHSEGKWFVNLKWNKRGDLNMTRQDIHAKVDKLIDEQL